MVHTCTVSQLTWFGVTAQKVHDARLSFTKEAWLTCLLIPQLPCPLLDPLRTHLYRIRQSTIASHILRRHVVQLTEQLNGLAYDVAQEELKYPADISMLSHKRTLYG